MDEKEILKRIKKGDESAIKILFERYFEGLCLYAVGIIKNHEIAEEIVEDLFINLWLNASEISIRFSLKSYLYKSIHNNCLKYLSKLQTELKRMDDYHYQLMDKEITSPIVPFHPVSHLILKELEEKAEKIFNSLPDQCREIYALNRYEDLNYSEIAAKLNVSISTVKTQMSRAFKKFREGLKDYLVILVTAGNLFIN